MPSRNQYGYAVERKVTLMQSNSYTSKMMLKKMYPPEKVIVEPLVITDNDVILGYKTEDFTDKNNAQLLNLGIFERGETGSVNIGFLGITGSGKTAEAWKFIENFVFRFRYCFFEIDVKHEAWIHRKPLYSLPGKEAIDASLEQLGQTRQGLDLLIVAPRGIISKEDTNVDVWISVGWKDIQDIAKYDNGEAIKILADILGISTTDDDSLDILDRAIEDGIETVEDFYKFVMAINKKEGIDYAGSTKILRKLKLRMDKDILSDKYTFDLLGEMKKRQGAGGVVLAGKIKVAGLNNYVDLSYEAVIKMLMLKIEYDGFAWNVGKNPNAVLQTDCVVHVGELDTFAPADDRSPMSRFMRDRSTKGRQSGVNYFFDVQESSTVDAELFNQIKILDCATVSDSNAKTLERKGINKNNIAYLQKLRREVWPIHNGRKIGYKVAERCVIDRLNHIIIFVPGVPQSQFMFKKSK